MARRGAGLMHLPWHRLLWALPPERAHDLALRLARFAPAARWVPDPRLRTRLAGLELAHPVGLAAGFDKNGIALAGLARLGFAMLEIGTVTPRPQSGNPRPRLFRLRADEALINRMGFNNDGLAAVARHLAARPIGGPLIGANIGINKDAASALDDYLAGLRALGPHADYVTVNVSSPNTPGLRALQKESRLRALVEPLLQACRELEAGRGRRLPLLVKIAPDLDETDEAAIADVALGTGLHGLIIANTTIARPEGLRSEYRAETGGLSGRPLMTPATELLRRMRRRVGPGLALVGVGGIFGEADAWAKIRAGADAVQVYTGLVYRGPGLVRAIASGLARRLDAAGMSALRDAVGVDA